MRFRSWLMQFVVLVGAAVAFSVKADPPTGYPFHAYNEGLRLAQTEHKPLFIYFGRYGCGWCAKTNKEAFSQAAVRDAYTKHYVLVYVDTESGKRVTLPTGERLTEMELATRYHVVATPMFAYLQPDTSLIFKIPGIQSAADFQAYDRYVQTGDYKRQSIRDFLAQQPKS